MFICRVNPEDVEPVRDIATASGHSNWVEDMLAATPERLAASVPLAASPPFTGHGRHPTVQARPLRGDPVKNPYRTMSSASMGPRSAPNPAARTCASVRGIHQQVQPVPAPPWAGSDSPALHRSVTSAVAISILK